MFGKRKRQLPMLRGEIVGRRVWRVRSEFWARKGGGDGYEWPWVLGPMWAENMVWGVGTNAARCARGASHGAPNERCSCGLYAYYKPPSLADGGVHGVITAWGDVMLHSDGFRAQYARVAALVDNRDDWRDWVRELAARYQVRLIFREQFEDDSFIKEFGEVVPEELRPKEPTL